MFPSEYVAEFCPNNEHACGVSISQHHHYHGGLHLLTYPSMYEEITQLVSSNECKSFVTDIREVVTTGISKLVRKRETQTL